MWIARFGPAHRQIVAPGALLLQPWTRLIAAKTLAEYRIPGDHTSINLIDGIATVFFVDFLRKLSFCK
jgi:hypothetical protein